MISGLRKSFGSTEVLGGIDLTIRGGDFVGLMGPNGAGKSTLIKILDGVYDRSSGQIQYGGEAVSKLGERPEVGFIHQDLGLVDELSISDNLRLGEQPMRRIGPFVDRGREREAAVRALANVGLELPVETLIGQLSPGEKTLVAITRVLERGARVIFVDEATSTLPPHDSHRLIEALKQTAARGATVIMVSHKLSEILDATNRVVLLLDGKIVADSPAASLDRSALVEMLVTREKEDVAQEATAKPRPAGGGKELLRLEDVKGGLIDGVDLILKSGEIVGLTGLPGSGLHDVAHLAHGTMKPRGGKVVRAAGCTSALVPPHRETQGGFLEQSTLENLTISSLSRWRSPVRLLRGGSERRDAGEVMDRLSVRPADPGAVFGTLSGGNKQKVVFGRALLSGPSVYVLCEPTRGVDVGTRMEIYKLIEDLASGGAGVLVVTSDSEDLFAICNRIAVVVDGRLGAFIEAEETNPQQLEAFI
ncbi:MAG: sugar ABC transporter ATP-binding protein [Actinobacteria bacterium]|nr:sugar ABC transporter ATP-binding protein [Actinomycetota bacterium]